VRSRHRRRSGSIYAAFGLTEDAYAQGPVDRARLEKIGPVQLKGVDRPETVHRAVRE
jgi:class 3 adenylate cyclase